jgi:uncharacterized membrane protein
MLKIPAFRLLFLLNAFGIALVIVRYCFTGVGAYFFLWWNVFLAALPFGISLLLEQQENLRKNTVTFLAFMALWLLFLPNAPYIVTDLLHLAYSQQRWVWFDILMILTFAISGLIFGLLSLQKMAGFVRAKTNKFVSFLFVSSSLFASGFGVYLGRYQRYNSWDLVQHPNGLFQDILGRITDPFAHPRTWGMTILVGVFLHILYYGFQNNPLAAERE